MKQMVRKTTRPLKRSFSTEFYLRARQEIGLNQYYYVCVLYFLWLNNSQHCKPPPIVFTVNIWLGICCASVSGITDIRTSLT